MSTASDKNKQALRALFANEALVEKLNQTRIAVVTPESRLSKSGELLSAATADVLARLWPNIDFKGAGATLQLDIAFKAALSGNAPTNGLTLNLSGNYDCVVCIDCNLSGEFGFEINVGANEWKVQLGKNASCGDSANPVGPAFAAALAAAQVFQHVFAAELANMDVEPITEYEADLAELFEIPELTEYALNLKETHILGVGAVSHGLIWLLQNWPGPIKGLLNLVDQDKYGTSNGQRYAFMQHENVDLYKVNVIADRLSAAHLDLNVLPHAKDLNSYYEDRGYEQPIYRAIAGLDSAEARRHVAFKLPKKAINMWTEGVRIGGGVYKPENAGACLACGYVENKGKPMDEVAEIHAQTGLNPDIVRELLDTGRGLDAAEAHKIGENKGLDYNQFYGQPLRSVLPALCATGRLEMANNSEAVDVPFAFASLFAGIVGFIMLIKDTATESVVSQEWTQHLFKKPTTWMKQNRLTNNDCVCCNAMQHLNLLSLPKH